MPYPCGISGEISRQRDVYKRQVLDCLRESTADIHNIKAYLLEMLFNAPATCGSYYRAKVNHDFHDSG